MDLLCCVLCKYFVLIWLKIGRYVLIYKVLVLKCLFCFIGLNILKYGIVFVFVEVDYCYLWIFDVVL